jgi:hypothetical protein
MVTLRAAPIHPTASMGLIIGTGFVALLIATALWAVVRHTVMLAHVGGHAVAAAILGVTVERLVIGRDGNEEVRSINVPANANVLILLSGYTGPSVFGLVGAILLNTGRVNAMLWLSLFFLAAAVIACHSWFTAGVILATGGLMYLIAAKASQDLQQLFGYTWIWFLLIAGLRHVMQLAPVNGTAAGPATDSAKLREATGVPAPVFTGCFGIFNFAALISGALILVHAVG